MTSRIAKIAVTAAVTGVALTGTAAAAPTVAAAAPTVAAAAPTADAATAKASCGSMSVTTPKKVKENGKWKVKAHVKVPACPGWTYDAQLLVGRWYGWSTIDSTAQHSMLNGWLHGGCRKGTYTYRVELWAYSAVYNHGIKKTKRLTCK